MNTVSHREMRNNSGAILRRVESGESIQVTNNGRVAAIISPPTTDPLADLAARGQLRPARSPLSTLAEIVRRGAAKSSSDIVADVRGRW